MFGEELRLALFFEKALFLFWIVWIIVLNDLFSVNILFR